MSEEVTTTTDGASAPVIPYAAHPMNERDAFELQVRKAKVYAGSTLVPKDYQGNPANCMIALNMAERIKADPLMVMQQMHLVHGRPGWSGQFLIATFNQCGRFTAMRFEETGSEADKKNWSCRAYATELATRERVDGPSVTWAMVEAEGWSKRPGSKWLTMPGIMFRYRAGAFLVRTHAPEIAMGLPTVEELHDVIDVTPTGAPESKVDAVVAALKMRAAHATTSTPDEGGIDKETQTAPETLAPQSRSQMKRQAVQRGDAPDAMTYAQVASALQRADTDDQLDVAVDLIAGVPNPEQREELRELAVTRRAGLANAA